MLNDGILMAILAAAMYVYAMTLSAEPAAVAAPVPAVACECAQ